ncbi:helix-turn-helix domain-containing protein [Patescibacteria group bacterium]|nr:helix-turn-helix domain-containing protein [Patescibacteria group bacterium]
MPSLNEPHHDLKTLLAEALELRNVDHEKLAQLTGISERYIWAIQNVELEKLPPAPYVRGYLKKIAEVLHLDHDEIWDLYRKELAHKTSGRYDTLPENRFAIRRISRTQIFWGVTGVLLAAYLLVNVGNLLGTPNLRITNPAQVITTTSDSHIVVSGTLDRQDKLTINGTEVFIDTNGVFSKDLPLQPGLNDITFAAQRFLGRQISVTRQVISTATGTTTPASVITH